MSDNASIAEVRPSAEDVRVYFDETTHVATIKVCRGPHNFLDADILDRMVEVAHELASRGARALVLCSEGKNFCAGANFTDTTRDPGGGRRDHYEVGIQLLEQPLPIVAALQGATVGGGVGLALVADFRVASPESYFWVNFSLLGLHHGFGLTVTLPLVVGHQAAIELLYTGRRIDGETAHRLGLCDQLVPREQIRTRAIELATEIAAAAPLSTQAIRRSLRGHLADELRAAMMKERAIQEQLMRSEDFLEGTGAIRDRRPPNFVGR